MAALTHGPWLTWASDRGASVWFRTDAAGSVEVRIGGRSWATASDPATNFCGHVAVSGLEPATRYGYDLYVDAVKVDGPREIVTMPAEGQPGSFDLYFLGDLHHDPDFEGNLSRYAACPAILASRGGRPRFCIAAGDFAMPEIANMASLSARRTDLLALRKPPTLEAQQKAFHATTPAVHVWSDHDSYQNNNAGLARPPGTVAIGLQTYFEMWSGTIPTAGLGTIDRAFRIADVLIVVLDERTKREPSAGTLPLATEQLTYAEGYDWTTAKFLSDAQLAWLKATLLANADAPFKLVCSDTTWTDPTIAVQQAAGGPARDSVGIYYRTQRNDFVRWLDANPQVARGFVLCTADDHWSRVLHPSRWFEPSDPRIAPTYGNTPSFSTRPVLEVKVTPFGNAQVFGMGAQLGSQWQRYAAAAGSPRNLVRASFDTDRDTPTLRFEFLNVEGSGPPVSYAFGGTPEGWFFPPQPIAASSYSPDGGPSSGWTPQVIP